MNKESFFERKRKELGVCLNDVQKKAVLHTNGPLLLLASPGSGKTTTIIMKIGYLIEVMGIPPEKIKAVTFSKAAALDMKERFQQFFPKLPEVDFSTIHSLAFEVVRKVLYEKRTPYQLIEGGSVNRANSGQPLHKKILLRNIFERINGENITEDQLEELVSYISYVKNKLLPRDKWSEVAIDVPNAEKMMDAYEQYKKLGTNMLLLDYDDMLTIANDAFENNPALLKYYQERYDYLLTDESQDTSLVQHQIIEKLVKKHRNLCVVADDDQSIYGFRAAEPQYLLDFKKVYEEATILMMEQNYRSSKDIVHVANQFIKRNKNRYEKNMFTENPENQPIRITRLPNYHFQSSFLIEKIRELNQLNEVAILYRNNSSSILLMHHFDLAGIPFYMKDTDLRFFSHWVVSDILNFMRLSYNDRRVDIFEQIYTKINAFLTKNQMEKLKARHPLRASIFDTLIQHCSLKDFQIRQLKKCKQWFQEMEGNTPKEVLRIIRYDIGYEKALKDLSKRLGFRLDSLLEILNTLEGIAEDYERMEEFAKRLTYLEQLAKDSKHNKGKNAVTLSSFHSSKGLEFERVFLIDLIEGIIPAKEDVDEARSGKREKLEESTRLFYVAMTRAKNELDFITYEMKDDEKVAESQFVKDVDRILKGSKVKGEEKAQVTLDEETIELNENSIRMFEQLDKNLQIRHRVFGHGEILQFDQKTIEIRFQRGVKKLDLKLCFEKKLLELVD